MSARKLIQSNIKNPTVSIPGSKYLANRYIALAAITDGETILKNAPDNDDIQAALFAIETLGAQVERFESTLAICGIDNYSPDANITLDCRDSGTLSRFITGVAATLESPLVIDASEQMRSRPMQEIINSLEQLDVSVNSNDGYLPIELKGPIQGGKCSLDASRSSQFLSGLLIACLKAKNETLIQLESDPVSESYIELTMKAIEKFSGEVKRINNHEFLIESNQSLLAPSINVASDVVSCSYFMAAALIGETSIRIENYDFDSVQGESEFPNVLALMGASVIKDGADLVIKYDKPLHGITVDMGNMPDAVPTLAVIAAFANGVTKITNIAHLAFKESNRIDDLCEQLKLAGVDCQYGEDFISITGGGDLQAARVSSCHDHRLAMSLALLGIKVPNLIVDDAQAVEKSFPLYWQYLEQIGIVTEEVS